MSGASICQLPDEVLVVIFSFLPAEDVLRVATVCSRWSQLAEDRHVWRGKSFLSEGSRGLSDALPIAKTLPTLKRVSICWSKYPKIYLNGEIACFKVPNLRNEATTSAISTLVTEDLSVDFCLLEESCSNCLVVQLHELKHLKISAVPMMLCRDTIVPKLWALSGTLSREPLSNLQSVDILTDNCFMNLDMNVSILGALSTCSALEHVAIRTSCFLSWHTVTEFSNLKFLHLKNCCIQDTSHLDLCPNLHSLTLEECKLPGWQALSTKSELRSLILRNLNITTELVHTLCRASPKLEKITLDRCPYVADTLFLSHCPQLCSVEVNQCGRMLLYVKHLPTGLQHLRLNSPYVTSDSLAEILQDVPRLEILDVLSNRVGSLSFLRHCPGLIKLSLESSNTFQHLYELVGLKGLKKLYLSYSDSDARPLADALSKLPQLEVLSVYFKKSISELSFLQYCQQLHCLTLGLCFHTSGECLSFHRLSNLKELRKLVLLYRNLHVEDLVAFLPSMLHLEELQIGLVGAECDFSFLCHCSRLISLQFSCRDGDVPHLTQLRQLKCLRRLTVTGLSADRQSLAEEVLRLPKLEYFGLQSGGPNLLDSWEWRNMLSLLSSKG